MSIQINHENTISFERPLTRVVKQNVVITNPNDKPIAFKFKTTAPKLYCVRPNSDFVPPGGTIDVQIMLQSQQEEPDMNFKCKDKFLILSALVSDKTEDKNITDFWSYVEDNDKKSIHERKLRCVYVPNGTNTHSAKSNHVEAAPATPVAPASPAARSIPSSTQESTNQSQEEKMKKMEEELEMYKRQVKNLREAEPVVVEKLEVKSGFPPSTSYTAPNHLPFKDGISWASFEYLTQLAKKEDGPKSVSIIPVGITYSTKNRWRSEMVVEYGDPIVQTLDDLEEFHNDPKKSVKILTDRIAKGVERSTINSPDWDTSHAASEARFILFGDSRGVRLEEYVHVSQSFVSLFHPKNTDNKEAIYYKERMKLKERLLMFSKNLKSLRLNAGDISMYENQEITMTRATLRLVSTWMGLVVQIPLFLPGIIINSPFYILGRLIDSYEPYTESVSQDKLIFSFFLAIPVYGTLIWLLWKLTGYGLISLIFVLMLLPLFAWYHMALIDKNYDMLKQVIASWRIFIAITSGTTGVDADWTHSREALEDCVRLRRWCRDQTKVLIYNLAKEGDEEAQYLVDYGKPLFESLIHDDEKQQ
ncbi:hypothetical protein [Parasitella parasitica]|uniref:MSP domain-containing protein n=1 Tax=Parasitella parasitica TaxID=35722 RepID=A0A0B7N4I2_9FUNG|nr:hypothetical protein [Parasitella parasitica]